MDLYYVIYRIFTGIIYTRELFHMDAHWALAAVGVEKSKAAALHRIEAWEKLKFGSETYMSGLT
jgi:hypothetical protein